MNILYLADLNSIHDVKWISYFSSKGYGCYVIQRGKHYDQFLESGKEYPGISVIGKISDYSTFRFWKNHSQYVKLKEYFKEYQIDIFHIMYAEPNVLWALVKNVCSIKIVLTTRGTDILKTIPMFFKGRILLNKLVSRNYRKAFSLLDHITSTSITQKEKVEELFGKSISTHIIRTGIDITGMEVAGNTRQLIEARYILFPRKMKPIYYHEFTIESLRLLPKAIKSSYEMVFIDKDSPERDYIKLISSLMEQNPDIKFRFLNGQSQESIKSLYKNASLIVMNPHSDGSSVTAIEAMYLEKPLIMGPLKYDPEIFDRVPKLSGWDREEMARLIARELKSPTDYKGQEVVMKYANRTIEMEKLNSIYDALFT